MLKGVVINKGITPATDLAPSEILTEENCVVILDEKNKKIYLWRGRSAGISDKFKAARLAHQLNWKLFGGAALVIQRKDVIKKQLNTYPKIDAEISKSVIRSILG
ncbi:MAG: hypothetical protein ACP6IQ_02905 [Candidatus Njordarchaeia archaeon]|nr:hypothetical protein [Candidatus Korarchaeota archaeon]